MSNIDDIHGFLSAYSFDDVKGALKLFAKERYNTKKQWVAEWDEIQSKWIDIGSSDELHDHIPKIYESNLEWRVINGRIQVRNAPTQDYSKEKVEVESGVETKQKPKADLSMQPTDKICITCGGTLAYEPICGGCRLGRLGFKGRFVCMEDMDHEFYVLREGIILPNQGD